MADLVEVRVRPGWVLTGQPTNPHVDVKCTLKEGDLGNLSPEQARQLAAVGAVEIVNA